MAMVGFNASVEFIRKARLANRAIATKHNLSTDPEGIASELEAYTRLRLGIPEPSFFDQPNRPPSSGEAVAGIISRLMGRFRKANTGVQTLSDWWGSGGNPVPAVVANDRAMTCSMCPQNEKNPDWFSLFTVPVADRIQSLIEERKQMKLETPNDEELGRCRACDCPLKLKVHVPLEEIKRHMKPQEASKLDQSCWILLEP